MIVGFDPGLAGGIAVLTDDGKFVAVRKMPLDKRRKFSPEGLWNLLAGIDKWAGGDVHCCVEKLLSLPSDTNKVKVAVDAYRQDQTDENYEAILAQLKKTDGRVGSVTMGINWGVIRGQIAALGWPCTIVSPRTWQAEMFKTVAGKQTTKQKAYEVCCQLWPDKRGEWEKKRGFHDGACDSLCIAEYLRRKIK